MNGTGKSTYLQGMVLQYTAWGQEGKKENEDNIQHILFGLPAKSVPKQKNPDAELWYYKFSHIPFIKFVCVGLSQRALAS